MSTSLPTPVPVVPGPKGVAAVARAVGALLDAEGPAFELFPPDREVDPEPGPAGLGVVLATSGSTGRPLRVMISRSALLAAATAGAHALGPPGHWLTAVPVTGAGGLLTVVRALLAGAAPIPWPGVGGAEPFTASSFADAGTEVLRRAATDGVPAYVSLVPTQLVRIARNPRATGTLAGFAGVLVGGAALAPALGQSLERNGARLVATYGATETCGGVVYEGRALPGVTVAVDAAAEAIGPVRVGGATIATGYVGRPELTEERFRDGWFHSSDLGALSAGVLRVVGRADHLVKVGGELVSLAAVAAELRADVRVLDATVVAGPDPEWGHRPDAYVVPASDLGQAEHLADDLATRVATSLGRRARPRISIVAELPSTPAGKPVVRQEA